MTRKLEKLVEVLPEGLSEEGIEEVASLLDEVVEERVAEEISSLETKVKAFLRTKLDEIKATALKELEADNEVVRGYKMFEAIKSIVASEIDTEDVENAVSAYEAEAAELQRELEAAKEQLEEALRTVSLLESKLETQEEEFVQLAEALVEEREQAEIPFKSSEAAVMITNESNPGLPNAARDNIFLTEEIINLSVPQRS